MSAGQVSGLVYDPGLALPASRPVLTHMGRKGRGGEVNAMSNEQIAEFDASMVGGVLTAAPTESLITRTCCLIRMPHAHLVQSQIYFTTRLWVRLLVYLLDCLFVCCLFVVCLSCLYVYRSVCLSVCLPVWQH